MNSRNHHFLPQCIAHLTTFLTTMHCTNNSNFNTMLPRLIVSLWQIFYCTVRNLTKFKTRRSLSEEYDGYLGDWISKAFDSRRALNLTRSICSSTPQRGEYTNCSLLEGDVKVRKCHAMLFLRTCMSRKWLCFNFDY